MKSARLILISLGIILAVGAMVMGLALLPGVQRWALLRSVQDVPGLKLEVSAVSAGWSGITLRSVQAEQQQVRVQMERLEADFSLYHLLLNRQLVIRRLVVTGLSVDVSRLSRAKTQVAVAGAPAIAPGFLAQVVLPVDLTLDEVHITGQARLPGALGQLPLEADFSLTGGKFAPGREGSLQLAATLRNPAPQAKFAALDFKAEMRATLTPQRSFNQVNLTTAIEAAGQGLSGNRQLNIAAELFQTPDFENYSIGIDTIQQGEKKNLLQLRARLSATTHLYSGDWKLNMRKSQLEPFLLGEALPEFNFMGEGSFAYDPAVMNFTLQGGLEGQVSRLETVEPAWRAFGEVAIETSFDLVLRDGVMNLNQFKGRLSGAKPVLEVQSRAPIRYDVVKNKLLPGEFATDQLLHIQLHGLPLDWLRPFITAVDVSGGMITGQADVARVADSVSATALRGSLQLDELNIVQTGRPWITGSSASLNYAATVNEGRLEMPELDLKFTTPQGDYLNLNGRLSAQLGSDSLVAVEGRFGAGTAKLLANWLPGAPVSAQGEVKFELQGQEVRIKPGRISVQQGSVTLLGATLTQAFTVGFADFSMVPQEETMPIAKLELGRLPLGLLPLSQLGGTLGGMLQSGSFTVSSRKGKIILQAESPVKLVSVSLTTGRQPALVGLDIEARPMLEYASDSGLKIATGDVTVLTAQKMPFVTLNGEMTRIPGKGDQAVIIFNLELPAFASQPLFTGAQVVSAGRASGEIRAATGLHSQLEARITVNGLVSSVNMQSLPVANLSFLALVQNNGAISVQAPLLLDNAGRRSDLNIALEMSPLGQGYSIDGKVSGQQVESEDLMNVLGVFLAAAAADTGDKVVTATGVPPDTSAAWSRFSGQVGVDIKSVTRNREWAMTDLFGRLAIEPSRLALPILSASFSEKSRLSAQMELRFTGGAMPYRLTGDYTLNDFDAGGFFKAFDPGRPPTVEGLFTVKGKISGNGETPARALDRAQGDFQLTSRQGIFRGLQRGSNKVSMTSKAVELGASVLGSILGSEKAAKTAELVSGQAYFVDQLAQSFGELKYDLLSLQLSRDERLNMNLQDISLISQEIRLQGRGEISFVPGKLLLNQPLKASLSIAARGKAEQLLGKLRLLESTKDELGYTKAKEIITVAGTLSRPDPSGFFTKIATAKLSEFLDGEN